MARDGHGSYHRLRRKQQCGRQDSAFAGAVASRWLCPHPEVAGLLSPAPPGNPVLCVRAPEASARVCAHRPCPHPHPNPNHDAVDV